MADTPNNDLQADAAKAILKRITHLAPKASASELRKLADAYTSVAKDESEFDPRALFGKEFNPFARFADREAD
jgi:hypothetical protein